MSGGDSDAIVYGGAGIYPDQRRIDGACDQPGLTAFRTAVRRFRSLIERARAMSAEVWGVLNGGQSQFRNQWADGFGWHPKTMAGRAFTVRFMPARSGIRQRQSPVQPELQPSSTIRRRSTCCSRGCSGGGSVRRRRRHDRSGNLFYYVMKTTKSAGMVIDGAIRICRASQKMDMPAYFRVRIRAR